MGGMMGGMGGAAAGGMGGAAAGGMGGAAAGGGGGFSFTEMLKGMGGSGGGKKDSGGDFQEKMLKMLLQEMSSKQGGDFLKSMLGDQQGGALHGMFSRMGGGTPLAQPLAPAGPGPSAGAMMPL